ncbi:MAG: hypothetical protein JWN40_3488, partial [Phycisphaerales bacterium]|nr:hypothetical protein [Phycisphaerales bacterium]
MPKVLLDHATISSAFRALGFIEFEGRELLDVEQTALERVCEAVLLADQVVVPDNYKAEFRSERLSRLSIVPFQSIEVGKEIESKIDDVATSMSRVWHEAFTAGNERGTFNQMFKKVEGLASFIWAHSGST